MSFQISDLGCLAFSAADRLQRRLEEERRAGKIVDQLLWVEHPPVITMGRRDATADLLVSAAELRKAGIELVKTDRGGRATYHGPGQLVGYFIFDLGARGLGVADFVRRLEEGVIRLLREYGLPADRQAGAPGVWLGRRKIAALGLHVGHGVTRHGFALNVAPDLEPYRFLIPCGLSGTAATSLAMECRAAPPLEAVKARLGDIFQELFSVPRPAAAAS